ncbi:MAG: DEAD/DEAH box helicase, partial [Microgenomates group bacterium]
FSRKDNLEKHKLPNKYMFTKRHFGGRGSSYRGGQRSHQSFGGGRRSFPIPKALDPRLFVREAAPEVTKEVLITHNFSDFGLHAPLLSNLNKKGFAQPTTIQDQALEPALAGDDVLGLADTGTGKTMVFVLPILNKIISEGSETAIIIAPTRELALQIQEETRILSEGLGIYSCLIIGGADMRRQLDNLRRGPSILIGTPGRLKDLYQRGYLNLDTTKTVVLDEVDRMLDMGFVKDITLLLSLLPKERQTLLFSATIDDKVEKIARQFMINPVKISVKTGATAQNVTQNVIRASGKAQKTNLLCEMLSKKEFCKVLVFGRTKHGVEDLGKDLIKAGFRAGAIHGNKRQNQRENVLNQFRSNHINILIATDVAARGIDVKDITHVINYDQPATYEDYVHRIGRTGRAGKSGIALTFVD